MHLDNGARLQMFGRGRSSASLSLVSLQLPAITMQPALPPPEFVAAAPEAAAAAPPPEAAPAPAHEEALPPPRNLRKSVDEATAAILGAMGKKSTGAMKRLAAALGEAIDIENSKPPSFGVEASRSQVMFRTGLPGKGQIKALKFHNEASKKTAIAEAVQLVADERPRRGL